MGKPSLPSRIPPQGVTFCAPGPDGRILVSLDWYLFFLNQASQVFGQDGSPLSDQSNALMMAGLDEGPAGLSSATNLAQNALALQFDDSPADPAAVRLALNALAAQGDPDPAPTLRDQLNALTAALDDLLPDPVPLAQPAAAITLTGSPFTYPVRFDGAVAISGAGVTLVSVIRQGVTVPTGIVVGLVPVRRGDSVQITYAGAPVANFLPS
jgi:hypothetical protein